MEREAMYVVSLFILLGECEAKRYAEGKCRPIIPVSDFITQNRYSSTATSVLEYCRVGIGVPPRRYWHVLGSSCPCFLHRKLLVSARLVNIVGL